MFPAALLAHVALPRTQRVPSVEVAWGRLPLLPPTRAKSRVDSRLSHVASVLAGRRAFVYCWSSADWKKSDAELARRSQRKPYGPWRAYTTRDRVTIHLSPEVCKALTNLNSSDAPVWRDAYPDALAWSVSALAHEAQHVAGVANEAKAECFGMQSIAETARLLGRTRAEGQFLAVVHWKHWYHWFTPPYTSRECRNGGRLDLRPDTDVWP